MKRQSGLFTEQNIFNERKGKKKGIELIDREDSL